MPVAQPLADIGFDLCRPQCRIGHLSPTKKSSQLTYDHIERLIMEAGAVLDREAGRAEERSGIVGETMRDLNVN